MLYVLIKTYVARNLKRIDVTVRFILARVYAIYLRNNAISITSW